MSLEALVKEHLSELSDAERRVAEALLGDREAVAFGTVAALAERSGTSGATVVRLARRLGFTSYVGLRGAAQNDLSVQLRPAVLRDTPPNEDDLIDRSFTCDLTNLTETLEGVDRATFDLAAKRLARPAGTVYVLAADCMTGIGAQLVDNLHDLRGNSVNLARNATTLGRQLACATRDDTIVIMDLQRYDALTVRAAEFASKAAPYVIAISDSILSPLSRAADAAFSIRAGSIGPFDSQIGALALVNALAAKVAAEDPARSRERLHGVEGAWHQLGAHSTNPRSADDTTAGKKRR